MLSIEEVQGNVSRLESLQEQEISEGRTKRSSIFPEWANGRVFLNATATRELLKAAGVEEVLRDINVKLRIAKEQRLHAAFKLDAEGDPIVILILERS